MIARTKLKFSLTQLDACQTRKDTNNCTTNSTLFSIDLVILLDFSPTVKAAHHECLIRTSQP